MLPSLTDIDAELARRALVRPEIDNSPEALARVLDILIEARGVSPAIAIAARAAGIDIPAEAVHGGEPEANEAYQRRHGGAQPEVKANDASSRLDAVEPFTANL